MRKLIALSIVALTLTLVSCAGKENKAAATDSTTVAPVEQPVAADTTAAAVADTTKK